MAASDGSVQAAQQRLTQQPGEPSDGYIQPADVQAGYADLQTGWTADDAEVAGVLQPQIDGKATITVVADDTALAALTGMADGDAAFTLADTTLHIYQAAMDAWWPVGRLSKLADVDATGITSGQALLWDGAKFIPGNVGGGGGGGGVEWVNPADFTELIADSTNERIAGFDIHDDGSPTAGWPDRLQFRFESAPGTFTRTGGFNEYGELRADAAKVNTVAARVHGHTNGSTGEIFQVRDKRGGVINMLGVSLSNVTCNVKLVCQAGVTVNNTKIEAVATPTASTDAANKAYADGKWTRWSGTQSAYDAIVTKDPNTLYVITG